MAVVITSVLLQAAVYVIMALGMSFVLMTGGIDLSQGSLLALTRCGCSLYRGKPRVRPPSNPASILVGALVGVVNGSVISRLSIPPFIMTLSTMYLCRGLTLVITQASPHLHFLATRSAGSEAAISWGFQFLS